VRERHGEAKKEEVSLQLDKKSRPLAGLRIATASLLNSIIYG